MAHPIASSMCVASALGDPLVFLCPAKSRSFNELMHALIQLVEAAVGQAVIVVDGVRGISVIQELNAAGCAGYPLFPSDADAELLAVSPVLFAVGTDEIKQVFSSFWGQGIASVFITQGSVTAARDHLAAAIYAETDTGEICIIRLHDPRTLLRVSDVFDDDQQEMLFKDVLSEAIFEGPKGEVLSLSKPSDEATS